MRYAVCFLCLLTIITTASFSDSFIPPEEKEQPVLVDGFSADEIIPWGIASIGIAAAGITVTAVGLYSIYSNIGSGFESGELQAGIVLTVGGGIITAAASLFFDFIINETDYPD